MISTESPGPDVLLVVEPEGRIVDASFSGALVGETSDDWIGRSWSETTVDAGPDKIRRILQSAQSGQVSAFRQINQRFPSGRELPIEYTAVPSGSGGVVVIGKSLQAVAELQSRLVAAQQALERDYWKLRQVETRYRLLFTASRDAVLLVHANTLRIEEANPAAAAVLGANGKGVADLTGRPFLQDVAPDERDGVELLLRRAREQGRAASQQVRLGPSGTAWAMRVALMRTEGEPLFLVQLGSDTSEATPEDAGVDLERLLEASPDGFVVVDRKGVILRANRSFLDFAQLGAEGRAVGQSLGRWLGRPGADLTVLLASAQRHGAIRSFSTVIHGDLGGEVDVELSGAGVPEGQPQMFAVVVRDVGRRLASGGEPAPDRLGASLRPLTDQIGKKTLRRLVRDTVGVVERHYIEGALDLTGGNRTAAAELLGLSRQSLYAKLKRYHISGAAEDDSSLT